MDRDDNRLSLARKQLEIVHDTSCTLRVQTRCRLVGEEYLRSCCQFNSNLFTLDIPTGRMEADWHVPLLASAFPPPVQLPRRR
jgi:hypothetical protein